MFNFKDIDAVLPTFQFWITFFKPINYLLSKLVTLKDAKRKLSVITYRNNHTLPEKYISLLLVQTST